MSFLRALPYVPSLLAAVSLVAVPAYGVTQYRPQRTPFMYDITTFTTTLSLPVTETIETVKISESQLETRLNRSAKDETVEPLTVLLTDDDAQIAQMAEKIARSDDQDDMVDYLRRKLKVSKPLKKGGTLKTVDIDREGFDLLDKDAFAEMFQKTHHDLTLDTAALKRDKIVRKELLKQIGPFFEKDERKALEKKIAKGEAIKIDTDLLPEFAKKMVKKYIIYRGPNCFHAALAFHSPLMTSSSLINVKKENGYHRAMINYDELWRAINRSFYEINPDKQPLKYGDMLVFFDVPEDVEDSLDKPVEFRWIRHTATYLFSGYTFSKGSKSPNTPYTVRTLAEEWKTWKRYTKNLGVKVFRRSQKSVKLQPPMDLSDWIY